MKANFFKVKCITNMHMGSGDINFSIVDNEVERDVVTNLPTMHSSGVKGAIKAHCRSNAVSDLEKWFGKEKEEGGKISFTSGNLLFQAVRAARGKQLYYLVTSKTVLRKYFELKKQLGYSVNEEIENWLKEDNKSYVFSDESDIRIENKEYRSLSKLSEEKPLFDEIKELVAEEDLNKVLIIPDSDMRDIPLPVIARNCLDGKGNLWYEEMVPHESIFYFVTMSIGDEVEEFANNIDNRIVQFGGNASVGYGLTEISKIGERNEQV